MNQTTASHHPVLAPITINLTQAIAWTKKWRESDHQLQARSFTFGADEFAAVLREANVVQVRLYFGLQELDNSGGILVEKLICVGVDKEGRDIIHFVPGQTADENNGTGIYDFSNPCPPLCNESNKNSPLN